MYAESVSVTEMLVRGLKRCGCGAGRVGGTSGSGIVSSASDVLGMSVVCSMRGVGGEGVSG